MLQTLPDRYEPKSVEAKWIEIWEKEDVFSRVSHSPETFSVVIPPPNVTGNLHIGHALNHTIQDIIIRIERKKGKDTVWIPGMDHAGIATQVVVERELAKEGKIRTDFSREEFIDKVWEWKAKSGGFITKQQRLLGESVNWDLQRFTLDKGLSRAVYNVFKKLHEEGLIYRGERIINWCPVTKTAISDIEVEYKEKQGKLYHIRYPIAEFFSPNKLDWKPEEYFVVATTRPETMFGDVAVCCNPSDTRYNLKVGAKLILPLVNKEIPLLADSFVESTFGSGLVKITPAHDPNDFEAAQRLGLKPILIMNLDGRMNDLAGVYRGMERFEAREAIVRELQNLNLIEKIENHSHSVGHNQRGGAIIEPILSTQWFVKVEPLAKPAIEVVRSGKIQFQPKNWEKTYFEWMENIRDWCISRQLWWGHRIPAYYSPSGEYVIAESIEEAKSLFGLKGIELSLDQIKQDPDVLDTWFSSGLWPFSVFGWPEKTANLNKYYPTSVLVTGFDIIFFWVARMIMLGMHFNREVPFKKVLIHGLVRDKDGKKFSKSLGNVVDPLLMMDKYGTDSFRFFLAAVLPEGKDILFDESRLDGYRSFCNKIWNSTRFIFMNLPSDFSIQKLDNFQLKPSDAWIISEFNKTLLSYEKAYEQYHFYEMANLIYEFLWGSFCDWYIEASKSRIYNAADEMDSNSVKQVLVYILFQSLGLLHPFMPFITEEIHSLLSKDRLSLSPFPKAIPATLDINNVKNFECFKEIVTKVRNIRAELGVKPEKKCKVLFLPNLGIDTSFVLSELKSFLQLSKADSIEIVSDFPSTEELSLGVISTGRIGIPLGGLFDVEKEKGRLQKELSQVEVDLERTKTKLNNPAFVEKAKPEVIQKEKDRLSAIEQKWEATKKALEKLGV